MNDLIYNTVKEYDPKLKDFEISHSNYPLILDDLITLYKGRNKMAKDEKIKELTSKVLINLLLLKEKAVEYVKFVVVRNDSISRLFVFDVDYSEIFFDFTLPKNEI
ncbi:hypothetical protein SAMN05421866_2709 [Chryseobacterium oranimense]|uniref:Uncharacterized protein n=1 Tax=Chryseobacterium oranimense TaxID=421058 RepID=A0A1M5SBX5_9FLAO|nr:hypothetical protein [Chryseobacterium oranimense]SHH35979.1 hypothetical protein SAMN05421866_2709 [Chryseobacterium oranimense]